MARVCITLLDMHATADEQNSGRYMGGFVQI